jgi:hypothetical protein
MNKRKCAGVELKPVIPVALETEMGGFQFEASPDKKVETLSEKNKLGMVVHCCNPTYWEGGGRKIWV